ncbi:hypothetical protein SCUCBS95973_004747 [Sporothrix curviconia]|uniref:Phosphoglycerate mutase family protein n=1 Tax=Sporothrix curviconia TaxID=1260050 RepID=A0ABP0BR32_9PEZI
MSTSKVGQCIFHAAVFLATVFAIMRFSPALLAATGLGASATAAAAASSGPTVYMIRHGEKPDSGNGLNAEGLERAQCLRTLFGASGSFDIGYIMAQKPKSNGKRKRPLDTVKPLAKDLGLAVDTSWEHEELTNIAKALGVKKAPSYPSDQFNLIWTLPYDYKTVASITSEKCPDLDK